MTDTTSASSSALSPTPTPAPAPEPVTDALAAPDQTRGVGVLTILSHRTTSFIIGMSCIGLGQYLIAKEDTVFLQQIFAQPLQDLFSFDLTNPENVISGVLLLLLAGILIFRAIAPFTPPGDLVVPIEQTHPGLRSFLLRKSVMILGGVILFVLLLIQMNLADPSAGLFFVWIFAIFLLVRVAYHWDRESGTRLSLGITRWDTLWLVLLVVAGLLIGSYQLDSIPNSLVRDEGNFWDRANTMAQGLEGQSFFDVGVYSYPLPSSFYQAGFLQLFGFTLWSWRFSSVVIGVLAVIPLYLLARAMFDRRVAVISGIILITLPYMLAFERLGYNNAQAILPVALALYLLYVGLQRGSVYYFALSGVAAGAGFYTYTASRLGLVVGIVFLGWLFLLQLFKRFRKLPLEVKQDALRQARRLFIYGTVFVVLALMMAAPQLVFTNKVSPDLLRYKTLEALFPNINYALAFWSEDELYRDSPPIESGREKFFVRPDLYARLLVRGVVRSLLVFHDPFLMMTEYQSGPLAGVVSVAFYFVGLLVVLRNIRQRGFILMLMWWFGGVLLLSMISTFPPRHQHMVPILPMIALFAGVGLMTTVNFLVRQFRLATIHPTVSQVKGAATAITLGIAGVLVAVIVFTNLRTYFVEMPLKYTQGLEDVIAFDAVHLEQPANFVYVYSTQEASFFIPWLINAIPTQAKYQRVSLEGLGQGELSLEPNQPYTIYFEQQDVVPVLTALRHILQQSLVQPEVYMDSGNRIQGMSYSFVAPADSG